MRSEIEVALRDKEMDADDARVLLGSNLEEIAKLEALSAGLLRLARFENGIDRAAVTPVAVRDLFETVIDRFQTRLNSRHIELDVKVADETVEGDQASLTEMLAVLFDNAIKYSPVKSTVRLACEGTSQFVRISVIDQGIGITASDMPHIFDRFYRADRSRSKEQVTGYGLGLSIAKRVADIHKGDITVTSIAGVGSTFRIKLPTHYTPEKSYF
jgi:signal transduction histidine kinase